MIWIVTGLKALASAVNAFFTYLHNRQLKQAGLDAARADALEQAERMRRERETIDARLRRRGDGTAADELRQNWSRD